MLYQKIIEKLLFPTLTVHSKKLAKAIRGKKILITGASYGIGRVLALRLAQRGVTLVLVARSTDQLEEVANKCKKLGAEVVLYNFDLRNQKLLHHFIEELQESPQPIAIFVNNAGKSIYRYWKDSTHRLHDFERTMALNYHTPVAITMGIYEQLRKTNGQIINVSAVNVLLNPTSGWSAYQASKTAFDQFFRCIAPELEHNGIRATSLYFPLVRTPMIAPNPQYKNTPAMTAEQAAERIVYSIIKRKKRYRPWWLWFVQTISFLWRGLWEIIDRKTLSKRYSAQ